MLLTIKAGLDMIKQIFKTWQCNTEHQSEKSVLKDKKNLKKASNITEDILSITDKYTEYFEDKDRKKYNTLKRRFLRVN